MKVSVISAVVLAMLAGGAHAGVILDWQFQKAEVEVGQPGNVVASDVGVTQWDAQDSQWWTCAEAEAAGYGEADAVLGRWDSTDPTGIVVVELVTSIDLIAYEPPAGQTNYAHGKTYFQMAVFVSDQPYEFELDYEMDMPWEDDPGMVQNDHFVNTYGDGPVLQPQDDPYMILWGAVDYTYTIDWQGWGDVGGHADTALTLILTPVPEPATLSLLAMGGLAILRRRRR